MSGGEGGTLELWLPGVVPPTLNATLRQHWSRRRRGTLAMAWAVRAAMGRRRPPPMPHRRAVVEIERRTVGRQPDHDGLVGGAKGLIDVLLPATERRPYGLGLIEDDNPGCVDLVVRSRRVGTRAETGTLVVITPLPAEPI